MNLTRLRRAAVLALPLLLVNAAAIFGQGLFFHDHVTQLMHLPAWLSWLIAYGFAAAVESIGVYLAYEAHSALMAGDASIRLRMGSYLVGALVGALNYGHFASAGYRPNPTALTFAALSSISPWLWAIRSRSMNRDRLRELGLIDPRAVRFSVLRWVLFPVLTLRAFRHAVLRGIVQPLEAIQAVLPQAAATVDAETVSDTVEAVEKPKRTRRKMTTAERVARQQRDFPERGQSDIAAALKLSAKTVSRYAKPINGSPVNAEAVSQ